MFYYYIYQILLSYNHKLREKTYNSEPLKRKTIRLIMIIATIIIHTELLN